MWGFVIAALVAIVGIVGPALWKRRKLAKLRLEPESAAIEGLRVDLWQAEVTCSAITWALVIAVIQLLLL